MYKRLRFQIAAQPDEVTCGPTCLHGIYRYFGDEISLVEVIGGVDMLTEGGGGTLDVFLANHALSRGYRVTLFTYNLHIFDPTWALLPVPDLMNRLRAQAEGKNDAKLRLASDGYVRFLELGGKLRFEDLRPALIRRFLGRGVPIMTGLSATYLYQAPREIPETGVQDDIRGEPAGHFVVLSGYDRDTKLVNVADPYQWNPLSGQHYYSVDLNRLIGAVLLGSLTYDANLLVIELPPAAAMATLIVVDEPRDWPLQIPSAEVVAARAYLTDARFSGLRRPRVYNLCESYAYQATGYYVSLLAAARGHRPLPDVLTMQDIKSPALIRPTEELEDLMQRALQDLAEERFELSVYFGHHPETRFHRLAQALFNVFPVPLLKASFLKRSKWRLQGLRPIPMGDIPPEHREFLRGAIGQHFARRMPEPKAPAVRYELAILANIADKSPPSDPPAIRKFEKAAEANGFEVEVIGPDDFGRLAEFDALFIRETTQVNHHTYRFASRARTEGLIVIDDPDSIVRCANKVYLAELMTRLGIPMPRTVIAHRNNVDRVESELGLPCVLKQPDSSFSQGVLKVHDAASLRTALKQLLERSDLVIAQEYVPTSFDWRVGVLDRKPLYVCRYYMARNHWQIYKQQAGGKMTGGRWDTLRVEDAPPGVVDLGLRAANAIGDGFYGVDIKEIGGRFVVMEVNDNPSVERSVEDQVLGDALYEAVMKVFRARLEAARGGVNGR